MDDKNLHAVDPTPFVMDDAKLKAFCNGLLSEAEELQIVELLARQPKLLEAVAAVAEDGALERIRTMVKETTRQPRPKVQDEVNASSQVNGGSASLKLPAELASYQAYTVIKELGRGGMGIVYLAKNVQLDRLEVLKVLNERLLDHSGAKERFMREARAVSRLSHPNIVTSFSILPLPNTMVFAMEYVHGLDLHKFIFKYQPLKIRQACALARQIAIGLQHAHEKDLVHRDIKPSNVIVHKVDGRLQAKVLDFGLAKATSEEAAGGLTKDGTMLGTPEYMAPEQSLDATKADIRADIYSLGCTLYHMLSGRPPFTGTHGQVILAHAQNNAPDVRNLRSDVPTALAQIVGKMIARKPEHRFKTPAEVVSALTPFLAIEPSTADVTGDKATMTSTVCDIVQAEKNTSIELEPTAEWPQELSGPATGYALEARDAAHASPLAPTILESPYAPRKRASLYRSPWFFWSAMMSVPLLLLAIFFQSGAMSLVFQETKETGAQPRQETGSNTTGNNRQTGAIQGSGSSEAGGPVVPGNGTDQVVLLPPFENNSKVRQKVAYEVGSSTETAGNRNFMVDRLTEAPRSMLENALVSIEGIKVVERKRVDSMLVETEFGAMSGLVDSDKAVKLGRLLGANKIVMGTIEDIREETREFNGYQIKSKITNVICSMRVRIIDIATGVAIFSKEVKGTKTYTKTSFGANDSNDRSFAAVEDALDQLSKDSQFISALTGKPMQKNVNGGQIEIEFSPKPDNCDIEIDGKYVGGSPLKRMLPQGKDVKIRISKDGYKDWEGVIVPEAGLKITRELGLSR